MKRVYLFATFICVSVLLHSINYSITFTGSGASTIVGSVIVQNLTKGTTVTVPAGNVLNLTDVTTTVETISQSSEGIKIFPNPICNNSTLTFFSEKSGITQITAITLDGRQIISVNEDLKEGQNSFSLSIPKGVYFIKVKGPTYNYSIKAISESSNNLKPIITFTSLQVGKKIQKGKSAITTMLYSVGDQLLYKGKSGNYTTIFTDKPNSDRTTDFEFHECKDADNNHYAVVKIGNQTWMAENLKTTKYRNNDEISNPINSVDWSNSVNGSWCSYNNSLSNSIVYGNLYNITAVYDNRDISPKDWHVATNEEWEQLINTFGGVGSIQHIGGAGGALRETGISHWVAPNNTSTNESGFTVLPAGSRNSNGVFENIGNGSQFLSSGNSYSYNWVRFIYSGFNDIGKGYVLTNFGRSVRCVKNNIPTVNTSTASEVTMTSAISGGEVINKSGLNIISQGICWSTTTNPTINDNVSTDSQGFLTFVSPLTNLNAGTTYYYRAFATNIMGTGYGEVLSIKTNSLKIGDLYLGGKIAYIDESGQHGFVCSLNSLNYKVQWSLTPGVTNALNIDLDTNGVYGLLKSGGFKNTELILKYWTTNNPSAANSCASYSSSTSDLGEWYLPSIGELRVLYNNRDVLGGFTNDGVGYWSSTEYFSPNAYVILFPSGFEGIQNKVEQLYLRPIKAF